MSRPSANLSGQRFASLVVVSRGFRAWECLCDCGKQSRASTNALMTGKTKSCGCLRRSILEAARTKHGKALTPAWNSWRDMVKRCTSPKCRAFKNYGGRGIQVCEKWMDFAGFYADMGDRPDNMTLERVDVNGNYEPGNCIWASQEVQTNNKRSTHRVELDGEVMSLSMACKRLGIPYARTLDRINVLGWSFDQAATEPKKINGTVYANAN